jgi:galactose mutarotase-like enzyme
MADDLIRITNGALSAAVHPLGAELWSLTDAQGREIMTDADPRWWKSHAPILFPIVGGLVNDHYRHDGQSFEMEKHGFGRRKPFILAERTDDAVTFRLEPDATTRAMYPFDFRLDMTYALVGETLHQTATVSNMGQAHMPFSFGYHPAFAWPLPFGGAAEDHRIVFEKTEPAALRSVVDPGLIAGEPRPSPVEGDMLAPTYPMFEADALVWDDLASRSLHWGVPGRTRLRIDFPDTPWLGLWQKPGAPYLCIEPWAGMADPEGFAGDIWEKPGIMALLPGDSRAFRMDVSVVDD